MEIVGSFETLVGWDPSERDIHGARRLAGWAKLQKEVGLWDVVMREARQVGLDDPFVQDLQKGLIYIGNSLFYPFNEGVFLDLYSGELTYNRRGDIPLHHDAEHIDELRGWYEQGEERTKFPVREDDLGCFFKIGSLNLGAVSAPSVLMRLRQIKLQ